jgi:hypothetical protein
MSDSTSERNERLKAAMRDQKETFLNDNGGKGKTPSSPRQAPVNKRPLNHVEPWTGKRS